MRTKSERESDILFLPVLLFPKAAKLLFAKAGLLTRFFFRAFPSLRQWLEDTKDFFRKLTASGNVQVFHLIPFYFFLLD